MINIFLIFFFLFFIFPSPFLISLEWRDKWIAMPFKNQKCIFLLHFFFLSFFFASFSPLSPVFFLYMLFFSAPIFLLLFHPFSFLSGVASGLIFPLTFRGCRRHRAFSGHWENRLRRRKEKLPKGEEAQRGR